MMGTRITSVTSPAFDALFAGFKHTAYRLETLQAYDVSYEIGSYRAFLAGQPMPRDSAKNAWVDMLSEAARAGKVVQRVHLVNEPLTDYLRYEMEWSYAPNVDFGEDVRILPSRRVPSMDIPRLAALKDYWLFDSSDLWVMEYDDEGRFLYIEQVSDSPTIVFRAYLRDAALHYAIPYADYMRSRELLRAS